MASIAYQVKRIARQNNRLSHDGDLLQEEFALYPEDVLERRTKLYLFLDYDKIENLDNYMQKKRRLDSKYSNIYQ